MLSTPLDCTAETRKDISLKKMRNGKVNWTRSGCLTCKRRRKRCDETKPRCHNCVRLGKTCEGYGSVWTEPLDQSAQFFHPPKSKRRRISPSPPLDAQSDNGSGLQASPASDQSSSFIGSAHSEVEGSEICSPIAPEDVEEFSQSLVIATQPDYLGTIPMSCGYASHLSTPEAHYLQYYVEQGSKLLANMETDDNPLRALIMPRAMLSPLLTKAVCAVSAMHLSNRSREDRGNGTAAANYYIRTLRGLRTTLQECPDSTLRDDTVLAVALLCKYEIVRGSVKQWPVHLDALQKLVISRGGFACLDRETAEFLWGLYMYAHNVAKITNRRQFRTITSGPDNVSITKLDIYVGYTEELIKICARIADIPFLHSDAQSMALEIQTIDSSLQNWTHSTRQYTIPQGTTFGTISRLQMVASCFWDAACIYLHSTLERMAQPEHQHPDPDPSITSNLPHTWQTLITIPKPLALTRCLERVESASFDLQRHCEYSALTFPLFIAGCESETDEQREIVMASLSVLEVSFGIGNVKRAKELLGVLWRAREGKHWLDVLEVLQWDLILA